jgi:hypothetical protein
LNGMRLTPKVVRAYAFVSNNEHGLCGAGERVVCRACISGTCDWTIEW